MYAKCGIINGAMRFFNEMYIRDAVSYTAIISGYVQNGNSEEGLRMFLEMQLSGINPEKATMASVLSACSHLAALHYGSCSHCHAIVCGFTADTMICNALIDMYAKCGKIDTARKVFDRMHKRGIVSWNTLIIAYAIQDLLQKANTGLVP
ncbi:REPEAT-CONTAINING PROTEIN putative-RELATED [Salix purpurea]|uniref:REPEAT-CONTAINING PROTEIN putative-RELATED n=1 Tax=Salix purpurea TaxID=77065 RepID=A0A9Q0TAI4_SALPP|nr:REPEAT-CONTAINING PROTEIN putative-RELATED [Salix purpurea]